jgi:hypothetical protein
MYPKFPGAVVSLGDLHGPDGNALVILAKADQALKELGVSQQDRDEYYQGATAGDYNNLLAVTERTVTIAILRPQVLQGEGALAALLMETALDKEDDTLEL